MKLEICPCGSGKNYVQCCQIVHQDITQAHTCEQLMRARYSAFVLKNEGFLRESWHSTTRPSILEPIISPDVVWLGLEVVNTKKGGPKETEGFVTFKAKARPLEESTVAVHHEKSYFEKENGVWKYVAGKVS